MPKLIELRPSKRWRTVLPAALTFVAACGPLPAVTDAAGVGGWEQEWSTATAFFDYDNDGDLDLYLVFGSSANRLYRNGGSANNWLAVRLVGTAVNRSAIGA